MTNETKQGIKYMLFASLLFAFMGAFAKELSASMNSVEIVFFRNVFGVIFIAFLFIENHLNKWVESPFYSFSEGLLVFC